MRGLTASSWRSRNLLVGSAALLAAAALIVCWLLGSTERESQAEDLFLDEGAKLDRTATLGSEVAGPMAPHQFEGGVRYAQGCEVIIWLDTGEKLERFRGDGILQVATVYRELESSQTREVEVHAGRATIPLDPQLAYGVLVRNLTYGTQPLTPSGGAWIASERSQVDLIFYLPSPWKIRVTQANSTTPLTGLELRLGRTEWRNKEPGILPGNTKVVIPEYSGADLVLDPAPGSIYWIGKVGFSWFPYRWERRAALGHEVSLEPASSVTLVATDSGVDGIMVDILACDRYDHGRLLSRQPWTESELNISPVAPGDYVVKVYHPESSVSVFREQVSTFAGEQRTLTIDRMQSSGNLKLIIEFESIEDIPLEDPILMRLDLTAVGPSPEESLEPKIATVDRHGLQVVISWDALTRGAYIVRFGDLLFNADVDPDTGGTHQVKVGRRSSRTLYFVDADSGAPIPAEVIRWSWLSNDRGIMSGILLPAGGVASAKDGSLDLELPPGHLRLMVVGSSGAHYWSGQLSRGEDAVVVELTPTYKMQLSGSLLPAGSKLSLGYICSFEFHRLGVPVPSDDILVGGQGISNGSNRVNFGTITILNGAPDQVFIPSMDGVSVGAWIDLGPGNRPVTVEFGSEHPRLVR
ncbi:MAG: hypothetical protein ACI8X5_000675 [Planctomycetota bacterium]|jgi:hypothetical protein